MLLGLALLTWLPSTPLSAWMLTLEERELLHRKAGGWACHQRCGVLVDDGQIAQVHMMVLGLIHAFAISSSVPVLLCLKHAGQHYSNTGFVRTKKLLLGLTCYMLHVMSRVCRCTAVQRRPRQHAALLAGGSCCGSSTMHCGGRCCGSSLRLASCGVS